MSLAPNRPVHTLNKRTPLSPFVLLFMLTLIGGSLRLEERPAAAGESASSQKTDEDGTPLGKLDPKMVRFKGKALLPDGSPATGCLLLITGSSKNSDGGGTSNTYVESNGVFKGRIFSNADYMLSIFDPKGKYAAPSRYFTFKEEDEYPEEIVFRLEEGVRVIGKVVDETTNKPVPNMELSVSFYSKKPDSNNTFFEIAADENGEYAFAADPSERVYVNVGSLPISYESTRFGTKADRENVGKLLKRVDFDGPSPINIDFRIPSPFVGRVLNSDGSLAEKASVQILSYRPRHPEASMKGNFVKADKNGRFRLTERPRYVFCSIWGRHGKEVFIGWFDDELPKEGEKVFQLRPGCRIEGRLVDSVTKKPLAEQLLFLERSDVGNPKRFDYMPLGNWKTDGDGFFNCNMFIAAGVRYELFVIPGRQMGYGGVPTENRVTLKTVIPEKPGATLDVGTLEVDMTKAVNLESDSPGRSGQTGRNSFDFQRD